MGEEERTASNDKLMSLRELHAKYGRPSRERIREAIKKGNGPKGIVRFGGNTSPFLCWESRYKEWLDLHGYVPGTENAKDHCD